MTVQVNRHRRKVIATRPGWQKTDKGRSVFIGEGEQGQMIGRNKVKIGNRVLLLGDEYREQFELKTSFEGRDLTADQRTAVKEIRQRYGGIKPKYSPFQFAPTPENIATMPLIREKAGISQDVLIPVPPQDRLAMFEKEDAETLAGELRKLMGQPVILTGGGGMGIDYMFLEGVKIIAWPIPILGPDGRSVIDPAKNGADWREDPIWYKVDTSKPPDHYSVQVNLRTFPGESGHGEIHTTRSLGSWRLTALSGYGAEKLRTNWPGGWE